MAGGFNWQLVRVEDLQEVDIEAGKKRDHVVIEIECQVGPYPPSPANTQKGKTSSSVAYSIGALSQVWAVSNGHFLCTADGWQPETKPTPYVLRHQQWDYWGKEVNIT